MDSTDTGDKLPEEKPDEAKSGDKTTVDEKPPAGNPPVEKSPSKPNWMLIALIVVSCVAVLLLAATITLGVTGGACHHGRCEKSEKFGNWHKGKMHQRGEGGWRDGYPWQRQNPGEKGQQAQPPQSQPVPPPGK